MAFTELVVNKSDGNKVFLFDGKTGKLGQQVWQPEPVTRFRFKKPVENEYFKEHLATNYPTTGIVFNGVPYIGTSDGMIYTPNKKIQRIPEISVDPELFVDEYPFADEAERQLYVQSRKEGLRALNGKPLGIWSKMFKIGKLVDNVESQERNLALYLGEGQHPPSRLGIRGFVLQELRGEDTLYDGSLVGITETLTGERVNDLIPQTLYQIDNLNITTAGFVPSGDAFDCKAYRVSIEGGIEKRTQAHCVDFRSLWDLTGRGIWVRDICPRDGSGYAPAQFATDGELVAISHGDHPCYQLDILRNKPGQNVKIRTIDLDPQKTPQKLLIRNGEVFGDYGDAIRNFSKEQDVLAIKAGAITSLSDSGLCTIQDEKTLFFDVFRDRQFRSLEGEYVFLPRTLQ